MRIELLTSNKSYYHGLKTGGIDFADGVQKEENCNSPFLPALQAAISEDVADLLGHSLSENTLRAYRADLAHFHSWGGSITPTLPTRTAI